MTNRYEIYSGHGKVAGREKMKKIARIKDSNGRTIGYREEGDLTPNPNDPFDAYKMLTEYLPVPDEHRPLFVVRHAPPNADHLKLYLAGHWNDNAVTALESLQFQSLDSSRAPQLPLKSIDDIHFRREIPGWIGTGPVEIHLLPREKTGGEPKLYSRVMFQKVDDAEFVVGAYWCWPYQQAV